MTISTGSWTIDEALTFLPRVHFRMPCEPAPEPRTPAAPTIWTHLPHHPLQAPTPFPEAPPAATQLLLQHTHP